MKIKVSHEVPIAYLDASLEFNHYDYLLPHLYDQHPEYKQFFLDNKDKRYIVMDNSLHELGVPYSKGRMISIIDEIIPNEFMVPDHWEDSIKSMRDAKEWSFIKLPQGVEKVAVVQGKSFSEIIKCYNTYKFLGYTKIAFSYGASYYNDEFPHPNKHIGKALGRQLVISKMIQMGLIGPKDRIHLLGCSLPQEFLYYQGIDQIESIDTSNPIMTSLEGKTYDDYGLMEKPSFNIDKGIGLEYNDETMDLILHNTMKFKQLNNIK